MTHQDHPELVSGTTMTTRRQQHRYAKHESTSADNFYSPENHSFYSSKPYATLEPLRHEIRLIRISETSQPCLHEVELRDACLLEDVAAQYTAVSYAAGNPKDTKQLSVNGRAFNVFSNLYQALKDADAALKEWNIPYEDRWIWADQICIDQSNSDERSHQVAQMMQIYQSAARVLVCLTVPGVPNRGLKFVPAILDLIHRKRDYKKYTRRQKDELANQWVDFYTVLSLSWFERAWTVQEFLVCSETYFVYGNQSIFWQSAHEAARYLETLDADDYRGVRNGRLERLLIHHRDVLPRLQAIVLLMRVKSTFHDPEKKRDLLTWLEFSRRCKVSDPRDRVYAFLGVASPMYDVVPDYRASTEAVFVSTAAKIIHNSHSLDILLDAVRLRDSYPKGMKGGKLLPTWVPDWTYQYNFDHRFNAELQARQNDYRATKRRAAITKIAPDLGTLQVKGIKIDTLVRHLCIPGGGGHGQQFLSNGGRLVIAGSVAQVDDEVWILLGARVPFLLRCWDARDGHGVVSAAVVYGAVGEAHLKWMTGAAIAELDKGLRKAETVFLR